MRTAIAALDHLVLATPDLETTATWLERATGVSPSPGGAHVGRGTRNMLCSLGGSRYLEIIGPDPDQPKPAGSRRFGIDDLKAPRLIGWVAKSRELEAVSAKAAASHIPLGSIIPGSRTRPDGVVLTWRYTDPNTVAADRLVPYFIDWGSSPHPSATAARGATLMQLRAEHPDAGKVQKMLDALGLQLHVDKGPAPSLIATIDSPRGRVELR